MVVEPMGGTAAGASRRGTARHSCKRCLLSRPSDPSALPRLALVQAAAALAAAEQAKQAGRAERLAREAAERRAEELQV